MAAVAALIITGPAAGAVTGSVTFAADSPSTTEPAPVVTPGSNGSYTVTLPGVGALTFTVDPTTGAVSNVTALGEPGFTATTPRVTEGGVRVSFISATAGAELVVVDIDRNNGATVVTAEAHANEGKHEGQETDHNNDVNRANEHRTETTETTEAPHTETTEAPHTETTDVDHPEPNGHANPNADAHTDASHPGGHTGDSADSTTTTQGH